MDFRHLYAFTVLAEELHFTRASERVGITQPQMSQWIRRLEADCGATLVERSTRAVKLTPAGRAALPFAREATTAMRLFTRSIAAGSEADVGLVSLGYAGASARPFLPAITRQVREDAPGVELTLSSMVFAATAQSLVLSGDLDLAFSRRPLTKRGLVEHLIEYERILVAVPSDHRLANESRINIADLAHDNWVMFPSEPGSSVRDMGILQAREAGFVPRITQEAPESYTLLGLVAAGVGVTLTVSSVSHVNTPGISLIPLAGTPSYLAMTLISHQFPTRPAQLVQQIIRTLYPTPPRPKGVILE